MTDAQASEAILERIPVVDAKGNVLGVFDGGPETGMWVGQLDIRDFSAEALLVNGHGDYVLAVGSAVSEGPFESCRRVSAREAATWCYRQGHGHRIPRAVADDLSRQSGELPEAEPAELLRAGCIAGAPVGGAAADEPAPLSKVTGEVKNYNALATEFLDRQQEQLRVNPWSMSDRKLACAIGCSESTASTLPVWKAFKYRRGQKPKRGPGKAPRVTSYIEGTVGRVDETLERLKQEQEGDYDPSPVDDDPPDKPSRVKLGHRQP